MGTRVLPAETGIYLFQSLIITDEIVSMCVLQVKGTS